VGDDDEGGCGHSLESHLEGGGNSFAIDEEYSSIGMYEAMYVDSTDRSVASTSLDSMYQYAGSTG
jgi:hypothetical protein